MTKLTLQEQLLKAGLVTSKRSLKCKERPKNHGYRRVKRERRWKKQKAQLERDKLLGEQQSRPL